MKVKQKGFTLVEMIIVLALFSLIMYSVVQLLEPVSKYFVRSSNFESTTACVDNIKRTIEGNLKYADRVWVYSGYKPYDGDYTDSPNVSATLRSQVGRFYLEYFEDRAAIDSSGSIYVLVFDNSDSTTRISNLAEQTLSSFNNSKVGSGKIILYEFKFDNYADALYNMRVSMGGSLDLPNDPDPTKHPKMNYVTTHDVTVTDWYVNQKLYNNYEYTFTLGNDSAGAVFDPSNFVINIAATEIRRETDNTGTHLIKVPATERMTSSFSMKNVLDSEAAYSAPGRDFVIRADRDEKNSSNAGLVNYTAASTPNRFRALDEGTEGFEGFYFIFTLPEATNDNLLFQTMQTPI